MNEHPTRRVRVLVNPRSGLPAAFTPMRRALDATWDTEGIDLSYQFTQSIEDGREKARRAVENGVDTLLVAGGDGTVNTVGSELIGSDVSLGIIPTGSGNGFARHFGIPTSAEAAVRALAVSSVKRIDVGMADDRPFFVTCSMAWDASLVRSFAKSPIRGILPYVFAGVQEFFEYRPQDICVELDGKGRETFPRPMVFTIANLSQYGGGARIAPQARSDDGMLELVVVLRQDVPVLIASIGRLFDGSVNELPEVISRRFRTLVVRRSEASEIQIDGELVSAAEEVRVTVLPQALKVLVPQKAER